MVQMIGDSDCFTLTFDNDGDGIANEYDLCPNTRLERRWTWTDVPSARRTPTATVQRLRGHVPQPGPALGHRRRRIRRQQRRQRRDAYPADASQWADSDGDGYGDNAAGTNRTPSPSAPRADSDGDGYGDSNGNNPDLWPNDSQWAGSDGDGSATTSALRAMLSRTTPPSGMTPTATDTATTCRQRCRPVAQRQHPVEGRRRRRIRRQPLGTDGDAFPSDGTQWKDRDGDGYGDNARQQRRCLRRHPVGRPRRRRIRRQRRWNERRRLPRRCHPVGGPRRRRIRRQHQRKHARSPRHAPRRSRGREGLRNGRTRRGQRRCDRRPRRLPADQRHMSVDGFGCAEDQKDGDLDGVVNLYDACPDTPPGRTVDAAVARRSSSTPTTTASTMPATSAPPRRPA